MLPRGDGVVDSESESEIEKKRQQLVNTANRYGINSPKTLYCSRELDRLLDDYQKDQIGLKRSGSK